MIPDDDEPLIPPLTPGFALLLAVAVGMLQGTVMIFLLGAGFRGVALFGMAAIPAYAAAFAVCVQRISGPPSAALALLRPRRMIWWAVFFLLWSLLLSSELDNIGKAIFPLPESLESGDERPEIPFVPLVLVLVFVRPLTQELLFRGALQPAMVERLGAARGVAYTALLNALAVALSLNPWGLAPTFANALVLGILRHASGSLYPPLILHALFGLVSVAASYTAFGIDGFDDTSAAHTSLAWLIPAALFTGIGLRLCRNESRRPSDL